MSNAALGIQPFAQEPLLRILGGVRIRGRGEAGAGLGEEALATVTW